MLQARLWSRIVRVSLAAITMLAMTAIFTPMALAQNTAYGTNALGSSGDSGSSNSAFGYYALANATSACHSVAVGLDALLNTSTGSYNTAVGLQSLEANTTGNNSTAVGYNALSNSDTGSYNIALGQTAGSTLTTGSNNIYIGNSGGTSNESGQIRIGTAGTQTAAYIAGIATSSLASGTPVVVTKAGRLGFLSSSIRYKRDIHNMGDASGKLMKLRPVTFRYKADETNTEQYGLIAEEVAKVYPELVIRGENGEPETVAYHMLPAMLLNEVQKQARADQGRDRQTQGLASQLEPTDTEIATLQREVGALKQKLTKVDALAARLDALERQAHASRPERVASATH